MRVVQAKKGIALRVALLVLTLLWTGWLVFKNVSGSLLDNYVTILLLYFQVFFHWRFD